MDTMIADSNTNNNIGQRLEVIDCEFSGKGSGMESHKAAK